jgi:SSS family solute:Na+ symporter
VNEGVATVVPWKQRHWYFGLLIVAMVVMFVVFSPLGLAH